MDTGLENRVCLVTGASGGIGGAIVRALADEGARLVVHYGRRREPAEQLARPLGANGVALGADLTREDEVDRLFREAETQLGPVEVLIANAGVWPPEDVALKDMTLEQWNGTLASNLTATFLSVRAFLRGVQRHRLTEPAAVLIGSTAALFGEAGHADYAAAKAGLTYGLLRSVKNEICRLAPRGRINAVCPGWTVTPMTKTVASNPGQVSRVLQTIPLRKLGRADDVARAVVYLASSRLSGHVSGQILTVAGGMEGRVLYSPEETQVE